jgi:hypothetical protein
LDADPWVEDVAWVFTKIPGNWDIAIPIINTYYIYLSIYVSLDSSFPLYILLYINTTGLHGLLLARLG